MEGLREELAAQHSELRGKRVRVIVLEEEEPSVSSLECMFQALERIHAQLKAAGHMPPSDDEVLSRIESERRSWEEPT